MKVIDATNAVLGRLASYAAKEALKGEEIRVVNCEKAIITGNAANIRERFEIKRLRVGSGQKGPKYPRKADMIVKRVIRGMLPVHQQGRGKAALGRVRCYIGIPKELESSKKIMAGKEKPFKFIQMDEVTNK